VSAIDIAALTARVGEEIGASDWFRVTQDRVDAFADATLDHQWIHQAGPRATPAPSAGPSPTATSLCPCCPTSWGAFPRWSRTGAWR